MIELAYRDDKIVKGVELVLESCDQFRELGMQGQKFVEDRSSSVTLSFIGSLSAYN